MRPTRLSTVGLLVLGAVGCRSSAVPGPSMPVTSVPGTPTTERTSPTSPELGLTSNPPNPEPPLPWGTRPPRSSAFFTVIDGMCIHAEVWPLEGAVLLTYGNYVGAFSRGAKQITLAQLTDSGLSTDDAVTKGLSGASWDFAFPTKIIGRWPDRVLLINDRSGRVDRRSDVWIRDDAGWRLALSSQDAPDGASDFHSPFFRDDAWIVTQSIRRDLGPNSSIETRLRAIPVRSKAEPALPSLFRAGFMPSHVAPWGDEWLAFGTIQDSDHGSTKSMIRFTVHGAVREEVLEGVEFGRLSVRAAEGFLLVSTGNWQHRSSLLRFDGEHWSHDVAEKLAMDRHTQFVDVLPARDQVWLALEDGSLWVEARDGTLTERSLPEPLSNGTAEERKRAYRAATGSVIERAAQGDLWAVAKSGALYHLVGDRWKKVDLPHPPFSSAGAYAVQSIVQTDDDVFLNAAYIQKEAGWAQPEPHRAILRTKRPAETLRCKEPDLAAGGSDSGAGFESWPPMADDGCDAPFIVLLRRGMAQRLGGDYPTVRAVLKGRAALGEEAKLVEFSSAGESYLGMRVPSVAEGRAIAEALGKKVPTRPEIVCGEVPPDRTIDIEVATGAVRNAR
jgi:hypothetical protein